MFFGRDSGVDHTASVPPIVENNRRLKVETLVGGVPLRVVVDALLRFNQSKNSRKDEWDQGALVCGCVAGAHKSAECQFALDSWLDQHMQPWETAAALSASAQSTSSWVHFVQLDISSLRWIIRTVQGPNCDYLCHSTEEVSN